MAKNKERRKKDRERRVAQKKLAAAQRRSQESTVEEPRKPGLKKSRLTAGVPVPKTDYSASNTKRPFVHRRTGG